MANVKKRLDVLLVERGLAESRQRAQAVIMSGQVYVREQKVDKAGTQVEENAPIEVRGPAGAGPPEGGPSGASSYGRPALGHRTLA